MTLPLLFPIIFLLFSCVQKDKNTAGFYFLKDDSKIYKKVLLIAKSEHPKYFNYVNKSGLSKKIKVVGFFGEKNLCVNIFNESDVIFHDSPPIYCFNLETDELSYRL
jgi:hypothetical protein